MAKTITLRLDDETYSRIKEAAAGDRRTISNYIEHATLNYLEEESFVPASEMEYILKDRELMESLRRGLQEVTDGDYVILNG